MTKLIGHMWELEDSRNFDEYMAACGMGNLTRKLGGAVKSKQEVTLNGDEWAIITYMSLQKHVLGFKLGEEFEETTPDGRKVKTTIVAKGDKLIQRQNGPVPSTITREYKNGHMIITCEAKNIVATRVYTSTKK